MQRFQHATSAYTTTLSLLLLFMLEKVSDFNIMCVLWDARKRQIWRVRDFAIFQSSVVFSALSHRTGDGIDHCMKLERFKMSHWLLRVSIRKRAATQPHQFIFLSCSPTLDRRVAHSSQQQQRKFSSYVAVVFVPLRIPPRKVSEPYKSGTFQHSRIELDRVRETRL